MHMQHHMKKYAEKIINLMKEHKLFADQGGPIIMAQVNIIHFLPPTICQPKLSRKINH